MKIVGTVMGMLLALMVVGCNAHRAEIVRSVVKEDRFEINMPECRTINHLRAYWLDVPIESSKLSRLEAITVKDREGNSYTVKYVGENKLLYQNIFKKTEHFEHLDSMDKAGRYAFPFYPDQMKGWEVEDPSDLSVVITWNSEDGQDKAEQFAVKQAHDHYTGFHRMTAWWGPDRAHVRIEADGSFGYMIIRNDRVSDGRGAGEMDIVFERAEINDLDYVAVLVDGGEKGENKIVLKTDLSVFPRGMCQRFFREK